MEKKVGKWQRESQTKEEPPFPVARTLKTMNLASVSELDRMEVLKQESEFTPVLKPEKFMVSRLDQKSFEDEYEYDSI